MNLTCFSAILLMALISTNHSHAQERNITVSLPDNTELELVYIPPGSFLMGSLPDELDRHGDEGSVRNVTISKGFYLGKHELTQAQWKSVMSDNPSVFCNFADSDVHPVDNVSWNDAQRYIEKLNTLDIGTFRLPTEAEWEYACRAGINTRFYWGTDSAGWQTRKYAWVFPYSEGRSHPVGLKEPNDWGLYDMSGNVWEWCQDWRSSGYDVADTTYPAGTSEGIKKVYRGGSWFNKPSTLRSANRNGHEPDTGGGTNSGFRLLMEVE
ncbi:MAG: formylglycine-generating enzyme family protein [Bacteroidota bacterium]